MEEQEKLNPAHKSPGDATIGKGDSNAEIDVVHDKNKDLLNSQNRRKSNLENSGKRRRNVSISMNQDNIDNPVGNIPPQEFEHIKKLA